MPAVVGIDPGFQAMGVAIVQVNYNGVPCSVEVKIIETEPETKKRKMLAVDDNLRRVREIRTQLRDRLPQSNALVALEAYSQPRHAASATKLALGYAVAALVAEERGLPVIQFLPGDVRKRIGVERIERERAAKDATKAEKNKVTRANRNAAKLTVYNAVILKMPVAADVLSHVPKNLREHATDAVAVALAALDTDLMRALIQSVRIEECPFG